MKRFAMGLLFALGGFVFTAFAGYFLIDWFSSNTHDRSLEAAMTSVFIFGPLGAVIGFIVGFIIAGRSVSPASVKS